MRLVRGAGVQLFATIAGNLAGFDILGEYGEIEGMNDWLIVYLTVSAIIGVVAACVSRSAVGLLTGLFWVPIAGMACLMGLARLADICGANTAHPSPVRRWGARIGLAVLLLLLIAATISP